nr:NADH deshydrogenase subunit 4L [Euceros kiushuensis]
MTILNIQFILYLLMVSFFLLTYSFKHLLLFIISMEFIMLNITFLMFNLIFKLSINLNMVIFFLIINVCESALFLSIMILMIRFHGNDYINSISLISW